MSDKILNHIISRLFFLFFKYSGKENETSLIYLQFFTIHQSTFNSMLLNYFILFFHNFHYFVRKGRKRFREDIIELKYGLWRSLNNYKECLNES